MSAPMFVSRPPRWPVLLLIFGFYLTLRGYHSRDNDQAFRLPLLLHRQDPALYADDPFVRAFDTFNPHRGYLALLDLASRPLGLSTGLFLLFGLTFGLTCAGLDRLGRALWPEQGTGAGLAAVLLVLAAKAGNIGTNHLFEAMLLDRLIAFALGWLALGWLIERPTENLFRGAAAVGLAALIHPALGLQLAMLLGGSWAAWALAPRLSGVNLSTALRGVAALGLALGPWAWLYAEQARELQAGLPADEFRLLSAGLQSPQHMLPHLWRIPQWLAFGCYPVLAALALAARPRPDRHGERGDDRETAHAGIDPNPALSFPSARIRLLLTMVVNLAGLAAAWFAVERLEHLGATLFQPFRMATVFRGLALVALSGRVAGLWYRGGALGQARVVLLAVGLGGDWRLVVATAVELAVAAVEAAQERGWLRSRRRFAVGTFVLTLGLGLLFLARRDTESGAVPLLAAMGAFVVLRRVLRRVNPVWNRRRLAWAIAVAWAVPLTALIAGRCPETAPRWAAALVERYRFTAVPTDDIERLALWCRSHTPLEARFIGPPGPKTFRLWSLRSLAFNRAGSPYHARGLADWAARFSDHVGFEGSVHALVQAYQRDRHGLERRYQAMSDAERAALAVRQGAGYVIAAAPAPAPSRQPQADDGSNPLELLHVEGRYAVYRVRPGQVLAPIGKTRALARPPAQAEARATASAGTG